MTESGTCGADRRLKVLMSAYACEPGKGSEPGIGWNIVREMAGLHDVWVLTRANNRPAIEAALAKAPIPGLHFIWHDLPVWAGWWKRGKRGVQAYYYLWQLTAIRAARRAHAEIGFDVSHHATFVKYWAPTCLSFLPVPYVWGPLGGGESAPLAFWPGFSLRGIVYEMLRSAARGLAGFDPLVRRSARRAKMSLANTEGTAVRLRRLGARPVEICVEAGLWPDEIAELGNFTRNETVSPVRFLSAGRLIHWKGYHLSLEAFARSGLSEAEYHVLGNGPERKRLERLCTRLDIEKRVKFLGSIPRTQVLEVLRGADVFVHPSLHDSGGWASLEAMAVRLPVICLALGGPDLLVAPECGIKVPATNPDETIERLADAMRLLANDPQLASRMGEAGGRHVQTNARWTEHADRISDYYVSVISSNRAE